MLRKDSSRVGRLCGLSLEPGIQRKGAGGVEVGGVPGRDCEPICDGRVRTPRSKQEVCERVAQRFRCFRMSGLMVRPFSRRGPVWSSRTGSSRECQELRVRAVEHSGRHGPGKVLAEEHGELGLGHHPLAGRHLPLLLGAVQDQETQLDRSVVGREVARTARRSLAFSASIALVV